MLSAVCVTCGVHESARAHSPSRGSNCLIWTSSTQSAGNQPVLPLTVPSQNPPSPMDSTAHTAHSVRAPPRWGRGLSAWPPPTFDPLPSVQLDLSGPLGDVGASGDEGPPRHGAVQPLLPHLGGDWRRGGRAVLHMPRPTRAAGQQTLIRHSAEEPEAVALPRVPEAACVAPQRVRVRVVMSLQALEGGAR